MAKSSKDLDRSTESGAPELKVHPDYEAPFPSVYSNFASITHTKDELCIDFCLVAPPHKVNLADRSAHVPVVARVLVPPAMVEGLVGALKAQKEKLVKDGDRIVLSVGKQKETARK